MQPIHPVMIGFDDEMTRNAFIGRTDVSYVFVERTALVKLVSGDRPAQRYFDLVPKRPLTAAEVRALEGFDKPEATALVGIGELQEAVDGLVEALQEAFAPLLELAKAFLGAINRLFQDADEELVWGQEGRRQSRHD